MSDAEVRQAVARYVIRLTDYGRGLPDPEFDDLSLGEIADQIVASVLAGMLEANEEVKWGTGPKPTHIYDCASEQQARNIAEYGDTTWPVYVRTVTTFKPIAGPWREPDAVPEREGGEGRG